MEVKAVAPSAATAFNTVWMKSLNGLAVSCDRIPTHGQRKAKLAVLLFRRRLSPNLANHPFNKIATER